MWKQRKHLYYEKRRVEEERREGKRNGKKVESRGEGFRPSAY